MLSHTLAALVLLIAAVSPLAAQLPTTSGLPPAPTTSSDPLDALPSVERQTTLKRLAELLEPATKKGSALDRASDAATELDARVRAYARLSAHKLEFADTKAERRLIAFVEEVRRFRPEGSVLRWGNQPKTVETARRFLEEDLKRAAPLNRAARQAVARATEFGPYAKFEPRTPMPDIADKLVRMELTAADLLPFLFHLGDCRRDIERLREEDRKLYELILTFPSDRDRFALVTVAGGMPAFHVDTDFIAKDKELSARHRAEEVRGIGVSKEFQAFVDRRVKPVFAAQARDYQRRVAELFTTQDREAIASLVALEELQQRYHQYVLAVVPDFEYRLKPVVPRGEGGKPLLESPRALTFDFDYADYVEFKTYYSDRFGKSIGHTEEYKPLR